MSLALYRKYRPATFAEVVGQEHVTEPLQQALRTGRIHHAYLFSGPRGCGKTTSARILARSLNCEQGPTPIPCGVCDSCVALAPNGPGSLDVIEIDAASHGGVDDARDLRERAFFAPVSSRFKIYVIDEAHMVSREGFNALLKLVEEPPPHVKFVFATTEPEKVLPTIKSRTFHYRFRLMPPAALRALVADLAAREGLTVDPLVLPLVVRAGAGSARDALSVLDQLAAGADDSGLTYERALSLLGYTDAALLDEVVDAVAAGDGAAVFRTVDRVVESGLDPRRFAQDLLERFRDLLVLDAVPDAGETGLLDCPADELDRMRGQAARTGQAGLTRAADVMATALVDMRGTTSPRLTLELACARILLPGASSDSTALLARLERVERRLSAAPASAPPSAPAAAAPAPPAASAPPAAPAPQPAPTSPAPPAATPDAAPPTVEPAVVDAAPEDPSPAVPPQPAVDDPAPVVGPPPGAAPEEVAAAVGTPGAVDLAVVRQLWDDVLDAVKQRNRTTFAMLSQYASVVDVGPRVITLAFSSPSIGRQFDAKSDFFREALREIVGVDLQVKVGVGAGAPPAGSSAAFAAAGGGIADEADAGRAPSYAPPQPPQDLEPDDVADSVDLTEGDAPGGVDPVELARQQLGATVIGEIDGA